MFKSNKSNILNTNSSTIAVNKVDKKIFISMVLLNQVKKKMMELIEDIIEKPSKEDAPSDIAVSGRYIELLQSLNHLKKLVQINQ